MEWRLLPVIRMRGSQCVKGAEQRRPLISCFSLALTLKEHPKQQHIGYLLLLKENLELNYGSGIKLFLSQVASQVS